MPAMLEELTDRGSAHYPAIDSFASCLYSQPIHREVSFDLVDCSLLVREMIQVLKVSISKSVILKSDLALDLGSVHGNAVISTGPPCSTRTSSCNSLFWPSSSELTEVALQIERYDFKTRSAGRESLRKLVG